jgi:small GTP-binding protein
MRSRRSFASFAFSDPKCAAVALSDIMEKIASIELEMSRTQKNKATAAHLGSLKAKLAKLRRDLIEPSSKGGPKGEGFDVTKTGDCRVGLVGFPSVGKSTLLNKLTGTFSEVAAYEFTTLTCIPGVIRYRGAKIQLLDLPGIIEGAKDGKGRGRQVISTARTCNAIVIVLDALKPLTHKRLIEHELEGFGIRLNREPPKITFRKKDKGGISFTPNNNGETTFLDEETVKNILSEYKIQHADVKLHEDSTDEELIDVIEGSRIYVPCIYAINKIDQITVEELDLLTKMKHYVPVSAHKEWNLDGLLETVWDYLDLVRVYTKPRGVNPDYDDPVVLPRKACSVEDFCNRLHKGIMRSFKQALVWGLSVKHRPQKVGKEHILEDEDVVQIVKKV